MKTIPQSLVTYPGKGLAPGGRLSLLLAVLVLSGGLLASSQGEEAQDVAEPAAPFYKPEQMLHITHPGNEPDVDGYGAVPYAFYITKERVQNGDYVRFLNAVDPTGENRLGTYNPEMATHHEGGILLDRARPEGERYRIRRGRAQHPVRFITWFDAARYVNWISNGATAESSSESGSYDLTSRPNKAVPRSDGGIYWIADENEWYKGAFYRLNAKGDEPRYRSQPLWRSSMQGDAVMEIVDPGNPRRALIATASRGFTVIRFPFVSSITPAAATRNWGFRLVSRSLPPVGEEGRPGGSSGPVMAPGFFGSPFGSAPFPVETVPDTDVEPAS